MHLNPSLYNTVKLGDADGYPYKRRAARGLGDWTDIFTGDITASDPGTMTLDTPSIDVAPVDPTVDTSILDANDARAAGTGTVDYAGGDPGVMDANDARAQGTGTVDMSTNDPNYSPPSDNSSSFGSGSMGSGISVPPGRTTAPTPSGGLIESFLNALPSVAGAVSQYHRTALPGGSGSVLTRIDPMTGKPIPYQTQRTVGTGGMSTLLQNPAVLIGAGLLAVLALRGGRRGKGR